MIKSALPKRVALFTGNYNHIADGVSLTLNRLVAYLEKQGIEVLVFGPTVKHPPVQHNGTLIPVPSTSAPGRPEYRVSLFFPLHARQKLIDFNPDLVHIATPDILGLQAMWVAVNEGLPVVSSFHTNFASYLKYYGFGILEPLLWKYLIWYYRYCRALFVPTPSMKEELEQRGINTDLRIWSRGVEIDRFHPEKRSLRWREKWNISEQERAILFVSRLVWEKNLSAVIDVFSRLNHSGAKIKTVVIGDGPAMEEMRSKLPQTIFTGGLYGDALAEAYASCDLFMFPSDTETFGNVTLEAMASGLPVVAADAAGNKSLVKPGENGFLVDANDFDGFAKYINLIICDESLHYSMAVKSRKMAEQYDWPKVMEALLNNYRDLLSQF